MILMIDVSDNIANCLELLNKENMFKTFSYLSYRL